MDYLVTITRARRKVIAEPARWAAAVLVVVGATCVACGTPAAKGSVDCAGVDSIRGSLDSLAHIHVTRARLARSLPT